MTEYWKWPETVWKAEDAGRAKGGRITAGVDVGTAGVRAAVLSNGKLISYANLRMGADFLSTGNKVLTLALEGTGLDMGDLSAVAATGWGAKHVKNAIKTVDEIHSHAIGARFMFGSEAKTVVDMGAQTVKAISLYDWDRVRDFMLNDKCATGLGRGIEDLCRLICVPITEIGSRSLDVEKDPEPVSTTCSAYAYEAIQKYGAIKGGFLALKRFLRCHPFYQGDIFDPVP